MVLIHSRSDMRRWALLGIAILALTVVLGCKRGSVVKDEKTFELTPTVPHILYIPACKKFEVNFSTTDNVPVNVCVMSKADGEETEKAASVKGKKLAFKDNAFADKVSFTANDQQMAVVFDSKKRTTVTAKISGE